MTEARFKIGDRVKLVQYPHTEGVVTEMYSNFATTNWMYEITTDNDVSFYRHEGDLELVPEKKDYSMTVSIDIASNVVIATLYEETENSKSPLAKGHGHMIHEGDLGIAQAASYACKRLYQSLGGTITKGGSWR